MSSIFLSEPLWQSANASQKPSTITKTKYVFSTELANQAAEAVWRGKCENVIHFHKTQRAKGPGFFRLSRTDHHHHLEGSSSGSESDNNNNSSGGGRVISRGPPQKETKKAPARGGGNTAKKSNNSTATTRGGLRRSRRLAVTKQDKKSEKEEEEDSDGEEQEEEGEKELTRSAVRKRPLTTRSPNVTSPSSDEDSSEEDDDDEEQQDGEKEKRKTIKQAKLDQTDQSNPLPGKLQNDGDSAKKPAAMTKQMEIETHSDNTQQNLPSSRTMAETSSASSFVPSSSNLTPVHTPVDTPIQSQSKDEVNYTICHSNEQQQQQRSQHAPQRPHLVQSTDNSRGGQQHSHELSSLGSTHAQTAAASGSHMWSSGFHPGQFNPAAAAIHGTYPQFYNKLHPAAALAYSHPHHLAAAAAANYPYQVAHYPWPHPPHSELPAQGHHISGNWTSTMNLSDPSKGSEPPAGKIGQYYNLGGSQGGASDQLHRHGNAAAALSFPSHSSSQQHERSSFPYGFEATHPHSLAAHMWQQQQMPHPQLHSTFMSHPHLASQGLWPYQAAHGGHQQHHIAMQHGGTDKSKSKDGKDSKGNMNNNNNYNKILANASVSKNYNKR